MIIYITIGISGSGKSSFTHEKWLENPTKTVIINRDKIRELLFGFTESSVKEYYQRADLNKLEKEVTKYENLLIKEAIADDKNVYIDATHLDFRYIERFKFFNQHVTLLWFTIPLEDAIERDKNRSRSVGEEVIKKQHHKYKEIMSSFEDDPSRFMFEKTAIIQDENLPRAVVVDLDGTIAHIKDRNPYEWHRVGEDTVDLAVKCVVAALDKDSKTTVIFCSGRDEVCKKETLAWLNKHDIKNECLLMRPKGDMRPDWVVKEEMWRDIASRFNVQFLVDDRMQVVDRARSLGLKVFQVEYNNF